MATSPANELAAVCTLSPFPPPPSFAAAAANGFVAGERSSRVTGKAVTATLCSAAETKRKDAFMTTKVVKFKIKIDRLRDYINEGRIRISRLRASVRIHFERKRLRREGKNIAQIELLMTGPGKRQCD